MNELQQAMTLGNGKLSTAIMQLKWKCPLQGKFMIAGSCPISLYKVYFDTEQQAIDALLALGYTHFQLDNCKFYDQL